jgi:hypothetical protein
MKYGVIMALLLGIFALVPIASAQSNLYRMRNGSVVTPIGQEFLNSMNSLCNAYRQIQSHFEAMTQQRDATDDYTTVMAQWGFIDNAGAPSEPIAEAGYLELTSMLGNSQAEILQGCSRFKQ